MSVTTPAQIEDRIRQHRLIDLPVSWADEMLFPHYQGLSLTNIPHTIAQLLGVPLPSSRPLLPSVWGGDPPQAKRVILFLMDGMGYRHLQMLMAQDPEIQQVVADLNGGRDLMPLTSTAPSTTVVALTSLWTGAAPAATGISGTLMFLRELSTIVNMLKGVPQIGKHPQDIIAKWGIEPEKLVAAMGFAEHLSQHQIASYNVNNKLYDGRGLSRILNRGVTHHVGHTANSDMLLKLTQTLHQTRGEHAYIYAYWDAVDTLAHHYGAHSSYTQHEIRRRLFDLRTLLADPDIRDGQTVFILCADHGHYDSTSIIDLGQDAVLHDAMRMSVAGDERHAYLALQAQTIEAVKQHIDAHYADSLTYIDAQQALQAGYFGHAVAPVSRYRIGDLILIPRLGYLIADPVLGSFPIISRHGGLSDWEMLIPFMWQLL